MHPVKTQIAPGLVLAGADIWSTTRSCTMKHCACVHLKIYDCKYIPSGTPLYAATVLVHYDTLPCQGLPWAGKGLPSRILFLLMFVRR